MDATASAAGRRTPSYRATFACRTLRALTLAAACALALGVCAASAQAAIPANYFTVPDSGGANDINAAQVDLTQFGRDDADADVYKFFWSWDATDQWAGAGQTGDACALFDSDDDTFIDLAACGQVENPGADTSLVTQTLVSPLVFSCNDTKNDRCAGPVGPLAYGVTDLAAGALDAAAPIPSPPATLVTDTDPFLNLLPDQNWPDDTTIEMIVAKSFLPPGAVLVNVCSYPSIGNGGNNNPFDCIVTPGGGFIVVHKVAPAGTTQAFDFTAEPGALARSITGSGDSDPIAIEVGDDRSVSELVPAGWTLTGAGCTLADGTPTGTLAQSTIGGVTVRSGAVTDCTFTNVGPPALTVSKTPDAGTVSAGTAIGFEIAVSNGGLGPANAVQITDALPTGAGLSWSIESSSANATCSIAAGVLSCTAGTLAVGQSARVHITSPTAFATCGTVDNTARAMGSNGSAAPAEASVTVQCPDLRFDKAADDASVAAGDAIGFVVSATNDGPGAATSVTLTDDLPAAAGLSWSIAAGSTAGCSIAGTVLTCDWGTLADDERAAVHVVSPTTRASCGTIDNTATLAASNGAHPDRASASTVVDCGLTVVKHVVNDHGGTAVASDWALHVKAGATEVASSPQAGSETGSTYHLPSGSYDVSETGGPSGYAASFGGDCDAQGHITMTPGAGRTCTITNDDVAPRLTVVKHVVNRGASTATASAFQMDVTGQDVSDAHFPGAEGGTTVTLDAGAYAVDESGGPTTFAKELSAGCSGQIAVGEERTCTITNTKLLPVAVVVKTGPAYAYHGDALSFTFEVSNTGATALTTVAVTDDRCGAVVGPAQKLGGDQDASLETGERWLYTCTMTVPAHAAGDTSLVNTVTLAATDADGEPVGGTDSHTTRILHPAIDIEKGGPASAEAGQPVDYGLLVTNTGDVPFLAPNVSVADALCDAPPLRTTVNGDSTPGQLDPGDRWGYLCRVYTAAGQTVVNNVGVVAAIDSFGGRRMIDVDRVLTPLTQPTPITPSGEVAAVAGTARLAGTSRCVRNSFRVQVRGTQIARVSFYVDGKLRTRVLGRAGRTVFSARIAAPRRTDRRVHRLTAKVRFNAASRTRARTLRLAYQRCPSAAAKPAFTG